MTTGSGLASLPTKGRPDVAALRGSAGKSSRLAAASRAAITLSAVARSADMEEAAAGTAQAFDQQDRDGKTLPDGKHPGSRGKRKRLGGFRDGCSRILYLKARSWRFGPSLFYHLQEKHEPEHAMADAIACPDARSESGGVTNRGWVKTGEQEIISRRVGQFS